MGTNNNLMSGSGRPSVPTGEVSPGPISVLRYVRVVHGRQEVAHQLVDVLELLGERDVLLVHGSHGDRWAGEVEGLLKSRNLKPIRQASPGSSLKSLHDMLGEIPATPVVVGIGGGAVIDTAKYIAKCQNSTFVSVPTQFSHDGICSPIAVLRDKGGRRVSLPATMPVAVLIDLDIIQNAPISSLRSGVGDLISNLTALEDWRLAREHIGEPVQEFATLMAEEAALSIFEVHDISNGFLRKERFVRKLVNGLILSGVAMEVAGTSRPCSGAEHLFSHAIDYLFDLPTYHGEQVAFGSLLASYLQGGDWESLATFLQKVGLPVCSADLCISEEQVIEGLLYAPNTRPDRYTVLNLVGLNVKMARNMLEEINHLVLG